MSSNNCHILNLKDLRITHSDTVKKRKEKRAAVRGQCACVRIKLVNRNNACNFTLNQNLDDHSNIFIKYECFMKGNTTMLSSSLLMVALYFTVQYLPSTYYNSENM